MTEAAAQTLPPRSEIPREHRWNAESVFPTPADWQAAYQDAGAKIGALKDRFEGRLADGPAGLLAFFDAMEDLIMQVAKVYMYAIMSQAVDTTDPAASAWAGQATGLYGQALGALGFVDPELLAIGQDTLEAWIESTPGLETYRHYLDDLFRRQAHVGSAELESVLGQMEGTIRMTESTYDQLTSGELVFADARTADGQSVEVGQGNIDSHLNSADRTLRRTAYASYADGYLAFKNTLSSNLAQLVQQNVIRGRARRYDSSLEASLFLHNIPTEVFHNLIATYRQNLPTWHRYWAVKRRALGVDVVYPYDVWAPLTADQPSLTFDEAVEMVATGLAPLGAEYVDTLRRGALEQRWVDRYPNKGKQQGAFSFGVKGTYPFIKMSFQNDIESMSTLAHELGHSMHSYFTWENQSEVYSVYSLFAAEVASNFNQALVRAHLLDTVDDRDFQIAVIEEAMSNFHRYFFIMPTLACFELEIYERAERGEPLAADDMIALMADLFAEGYGDEMTYDRDHIGITWAQFGHLYMNFYVYAYATGLSGAHALAAKVLEEGAPAAERYLGFLKAGSSQYTLEALSAAGVDLATPEPIETTFGVLADYVDRLEGLVS